MFPLHFGVREARVSDSIFFVALKADFDETLVIEIVSTSRANTDNTGNIFSLVRHQSIRFRLFCSRSGQLLFRYSVSSLFSCGAEVELVLGLDPERCRRA